MLPSVNMGIDQALGITGIVITDENKNLVFYEYLKTNKDDYETKFHRMESISTRIVDVADKYMPKNIFIEGLPFNNRQSNNTRDLAGLQAIIFRDLIKKHVTPQIITPKACKKNATGNGRADKEDMKNALPEDVLEAFYATGAKKTTGIYDLTDAYWLSLS